MEDVAIIIGRKINDNINRELIFDKILKDRNINPFFLIPGQNISDISLNDEDLKTFSDANVIKFNSMEEFKRITKNFERYLVASWRDYLGLTNFLRKSKKKITVYSEAGGIDYWSLGVRNCLIKSQSNIDVYCNGRRNLIINFYKKIFLKLKITGSIRYEYVNSHLYKDIKNDKKLIVFFPKSLSKMSSTLKWWYPSKGEEWVNRELKIIEQNYIDVAKKINDLDCNFIVKLHYASEDSFFSNDKDYDKRFWKKNGCEIFSGDERNLYNQLDLGIGIETHSAIDVNLHKKPFIYIFPEQNIRPTTRGFALDKLFQKDKIGAHGFNQDFGVRKNFINKLWLPYWYGSLCKIDQLENCINDIIETPPDIKLCEKISEYYWGNKFGEIASPKIIDNFLLN